MSGGQCVEKKYSKKSYDVNVNESYISTAQNILLKRHLQCRKLQSRKNGTSGVRQVKWTEKLAMLCSTEKSSTFKNWNFGLNLPVNEVAEFWRTSEQDYVRTHLPKLGKD